MEGKKNIIAVKQLEATRFAAVIFVAVVAGLFLLSFTGTAGASPFTLEGKIVEADSSSQTVTFSPAGIGGEMVFNLDRYAAIDLCDRMASLNDLKAGDEVTLQYREESDGHWIAEVIDLRQC